MRSYPAQSRVGPRTKYPRSSAPLKPSPFSLFFDGCSLFFFSSSFPPYPFLSFWVFSLFVLFLFLIFCVRIFVCICARI